MPTDGGRRNAPPAAIEKPPLVERHSTLGSIPVSEVIDGEAVVQINDAPEMVAEALELQTETP